MIVVSAAGGALGRLVLDGLAAAAPGAEVVAAVRDPAKAADLGVTVRRGDYDDPASLRTAFAGADRLLLISSPELDGARRIAQHRAAVEAAREVGVGSIVYTSFLGAGTQATGLTEAHYATERLIEDSELAFTFLRNPFYSEAFLNPSLLEAVKTGELPHGTEGRGLNTAFRRDLADAAVRVLTSDGHAGRAYDLTGPLWTYPELAAALSAASESEVTAVPRTSPAPGAFAFLETLARSGALELQTPDLASLLPRPARSAAEYAASLFAGQSLK
ncbi:NAD(P)H-binding protein [Actinocorallia sp. A-T 12471]|uniref:NAD(P)H-binding protein n=1 Tax=Actinocorallia sp. A-T 12471 TaxID=3089813 RepID=UPI0029CAEAAB|nr:NAD(P)H-binding protein [Actinocorallia sp. A-T 12471]MDX6740776.1 NAD(P)H-binding protein [Actinocorallia sp. A-T 12471]